MEKKQECPEFKTTEGAASAVTKSIPKQTLTIKIKMQNFGKPEIIQLISKWCCYELMVRLKVCIKGNYDVCTVEFFTAGIVADADMTPTLT